MAFNGVVLMMVLALMRVAAGEVYKVGDSAGWTNIGHVDYKTWSSTKKFHVGDTILFEYNKDFHNVVRVTHKNFQICNATTPYATLDTGDDSFTIKRTGHFFFICSLPGHCEAGQKVDIRVPETATPPKAPTAPIQPPPLPSPGPTQPHVPISPSPSPSPSPAYAPAPSPHKNGSSQYSVKVWLTLVALVFCVFGFSY